MKPKPAVKHIQRETLCWSCTRPGTRTCVWDDSKGAVPVEGWRADLAILHRVGISYCVHECPLYDPVPDYEERSLGRGRPPAISWQAIDTLFRAGFSDRRIAGITGLAQSTVNDRRKRWRRMERLRKDGRQ